MSDSSTITIEINGEKLQVAPGAMLIDVADENGIVIPRFCYHKKLSVAANCRMCLVDVEKAPKPLPACATPVMDGMVVHTHSPRAIAAQKATMEFLLINHPLDCPICDQGGECELQDVAMGYGGDTSYYTEGKRVVNDKDIGPLIATEMTRCIHCTRCIRFGTEIAGMRELGATGRGENMRIGTYIEKAVSSELSGNVIDLCPVGALTAKPSRYTARAWELRQSPSVSPHDCVGSNLLVHTFRGKPVRVVPQDNEAINECWISDRDRFSYKGLEHKERLQSPMIKVDGQWRETDWQTALEKTFAALQDTVRNYGTDQIGLLISPNSTLEEMYLFKRLANEIKCRNIDHRLRQTDFTHQEQAPLYPSLGMSIDEIDKSDSILLIGSDVRREQPIIAHRIRQAVRDGSLTFCTVNSRDYDLNIPVTASVSVNYRDMVICLAGIAKGMSGLDQTELPHAARAVMGESVPTPSQKEIAEKIQSGKTTRIIIGNQAINSPYYSLIEIFAREIANASNSQFGYLTDGANASGAWITGIVPHRDIAGETDLETGLNAHSMLEQSRNLYVLHNIEPELDCADPQLALGAMNNADFVVAMTPFVTTTMQSYADVLLPVAPFSETSGSYINIEGKIQSFSGAGTEHEARPAWKVLRVLGNYFDIEGFDYSSSSEILDEVREIIGNFECDNKAEITDAVTLADRENVVYRSSEVNMYRSDNLVRRSGPLQDTKDAKDDAIRINSQLAEKLGLKKANRVLVTQSGNTASMALVIDDSVSDDTAWMLAGTNISTKLGPMFGIIQLEAD